MIVASSQGLGNASKIVAQAGGVASGAVTAAAAPAVATALGISTAAAVPIVGAAFAGILLGVEAILNSGCGQSCIVTSQWANEAEPLLRQNIQQYFSLPNRTTADQQSALNVFDAVWAGLVERCSQPGLSTAGENCIKDRQAGACKWKQTADSPLLSIPGQPQPGECWNWFSGYRDPIARDNPPSGDFSTVLSGSFLASLSPAEIAILATVGALVVAEVVS